VQSITYYNPQCKQKLSTVDNEQFVEYRVRGTYGGDRSEYLTTKVLINATLSDRVHKDPDTKFATTDMVDFYLEAMLDQPGYLGMKAATFSQEICVNTSTATEQYTSKSLNACMSILSHYARVVDYSLLEGVTRLDI
jgi:hypothetical protein